MGPTGNGADHGVTTDLDVEALEAHLRGVLPEPPAGRLQAELIAGGRSNPTYAVTDGLRSWVLRRPPYGDYLKSGHDMGREVTAMTALSGTDVPVPQVVAFCEDVAVLGAPFYVMDRLEGRTLRTQEDTAALTEAERRGLSENLVATLSDLHAVDAAAVGLADWGRPEGYLARQTARWGRQWEAVATAERPQVAELVKRLTGSLPAGSRAGIVHGDYKIDNVMVRAEDPTSILAVLDWEMSTLGDTLADLGLLVSFWDEPGEMHNPITQGATALPGFPTADQVIELYASRHDVVVDDIEWYVVFSDFKIAVILEQIHRRHLAGTTAGTGFDDVGDMVAPLLDRALDRASRSTIPALRGSN